MINIGINDKSRKEIAARLNVLLSNEFVLYVKTLKFHWNIKGKFFGPLHKLFNDQYEQLLDIVDRTAERAQALDHEAYGTMKEFLAHSSLSEHPGKNPNDMGMIKGLLEDHEAIIKLMRKDIDLTAKLDDMGTNNFLCDLIEQHEKMAWVLRSHLEK